MPMNIAIDGPVGAGKSWVADEVAARLGILHLDTGAMYRTFGLYALRSGVDMTSEEALSALVEKVDIQVKYADGAQQTLLFGEDVSDLIRTGEVSAAASAVSKWPAVRRRMVRAQQEMAAKADMLIDGRDIGTVVLPDAQIKVFLTATPEARAQRRCLELEQRGTPEPFEKVLKEIEERDWNDSHRAVAPLRQAEDAVLLDTTELNFEQSEEALLKIVEEKTVL